MSAARSVSPAIVAGLLWWADMGVHRYRDANLVRRMRVFNVAVTAGLLTLPAFPLGGGSWAEVVSIGLTMTAGLALSARSRPNAARIVVLVGLSLTQGVFAHWYGPQSYYSFLGIPLLLFAFLVVHHTERRLLGLGVAAVVASMLLPEIGGYQLFGGDWSDFPPIVTMVVVVALVIVIQAYFLHLVATGERRETELRRTVETHERQYRSLVQNMPGAVFRSATDRARPIDFVSSGIEDVTGYTAQELTHGSERGYGDLVHPDDAKALGDAIDEQLEAASAFAVEYRLIDRSGSVRWIAEQGRLVDDGPEVPPHVEGLIRDVTERKAYEDEIAEQEQLLRTVVESVPAAVFLKDRDGTLIVVNSGYEKMLGLGRGEIIGQTAETLFDRVTAERIQARDEAVMSSGEPNETEQTVQRSDGERREYWVGRVPLFNRNGVARGLVGVALDITDRKHMEQQLVAAKEQADAASRAKSAFLASMSHEIRTPMNAILGYSQILARDATLSDDHHRAVEAINRSGEHLLALINDVLEMSKIESGHSEIVASACRPAALLDELAVMFAPRLEGTSVTLHIDCDPSVPAVIETDVTKLRQVLVNLVGNAVKFTEQGWITLRASGRDVGDDERVKLTFEVEDSGVGIPESEVDRIFEGFTQAHAGFGGTGLGLAIGREYGRLLGGDLVVRSEPGIGSTFTLSIEAGALADTELVESSDNEVVSIEGAEGEVVCLVADDRDTNRDILVRMLEPVGFQILQAEDGREAVDLFESARPSIVLMDLIMPEMDGFEATRRIRAMEEERSWPRAAVIAITASVLTEAQSEVIDAGADTMLLKPFRMPELFDAIESTGLVRFRREVEDAEGGSPDAPMGEASFSDIPGSLRERLAQAAILGERSALLAIADEIAEVNPAAADLVMRFVDRFELDRIALLATEGDAP